MGERLDLVRDFVNTLDLEEKKDAVGTPAELGSWLQLHGLLSETGVTAEEHTTALAARETVRRLLLANNGEPADPADLAALDHLAIEAGLAPRFDLEGFRLEPRAGGVPGALGRLLAMVAEAMVEGTWSRLKACSDHGCQWAFLDRSKNRSGHWCSMRVCGNRAKARQFRERQRNDAGETGFPPNPLPQSEV